MYHVDEKMMGRKSGRQYPWMLATHAAPALRLAPSTVKAAAEVRARAGLCGALRLRLRHSGMSRSGAWPAAPNTALPLPPLPLPAVSFRAPAVV